MMAEIVRTLPITHKYGLHARASTRFVEIAKGFASQVFISRDGGGEADGKSVLGILTLGIEVGANVTLRVNGKDAEKAMAALTDLIEDDFGGI